MKGFVTNRVGHGVRGVFTVTLQILDVRCITTGPTGSISCAWAGHVPEALERET